MFAKAEREKKREKIQTKMHFLLFDSRENKRGNREKFTLKIKFQYFVSHHFLCIQTEGKS